MRRLRLSSAACNRAISHILIAAFCVAAWIAIRPLSSDAQQANPNQQPRGNLQNIFVPGGNQQNGLLGGPNGVNGPNGAAPGGNPNADFETLIDLIQSTIATDKWVDTGGTGDIRQFASGGVLVDTAGTLRLKDRAAKTQASDELTARRGAAPPTGLSAGDPRRASGLRYISLPRLEREIARRQAAHEKLDSSMLTLAGLQRVQYVFVYPESGDLVFAGPAGDWRVDADGRIVSSNTGRPVVRLDDLLVIFRRGLAAGDSVFGCSINPRQEALAKTQAFLDESSRQPLQPGQRKAWLGKLRDTMGKQDIEIFGVDPSSRVASVLVEADYHMKLIGMGLADGVEGVQSYLESITVKNGEAPPAMSVLRWWFTLNYDTLRTSPGRDAYELVGQGVRVLSESELLAAQGQRVHTGQSDPLNKLFADRFTAHFAALADKYPIYADLRNVFDLAMASALIQSDDLAARVKWQPTLLANAEKLWLPKRTVPRQVETVINHRVIAGRHVVAGVSGGVMVAAKDVLRDGRTTDAAGKLAESRHPAPAAEAMQPGAWWWDAGE
jgi:hypothetical protein